MPPSIGASTLVPHDLPPGSVLPNASQLLFTHEFWPSPTPEAVPAPPGADCDCECCEASLGAMRQYCEEQMVRRPPSPPARMPASPRAREPASLRARRGHVPATVRIADGAPLSRAADG